ncbi:tRNA nucleotidyltransferase/poly(A) polymerase [Desulfamplus magnetovallimortis]|uniref:tRNA nucleotidyltransferase/poly(A) polymerase n=1 Tax=Desulfamplus magnetovallimortis TaxID=1246637 RepID=A0A1W1HG13_9BACT|nr:CCA tRNA nucleotidyltransferase [Desulfamplus magnetovallimortis]SLM31335.1 tRNA nucleotidyltransferase/poly(A) polymerase [Desulfamplus magnetovallimortis]
MHSDKKTTSNIAKTTQNHSATYVFDIVNKLVSRGFKAYIAGGAVRDMLLENPSRDYDIVTNAPIDIIPDIFKGKTVKKVGKSFLVSIIDGVEVASCRSGAENVQSESEKGHYYTEQQDYSNKSNFMSFPECDFMSFPECDLAHRDFTINSMAFDPLAEKLIDPFGGKNDLIKKIIRFTGDPCKRIEEDPLRMVRACRFVCSIKGGLASSTFRAIMKHKDLLKEHTAFERVRAEIMKAMSHEKPSIFFRTLLDTGMLEIIMPSLHRCVELDGGPHHGETVFEHCMMTGDSLSPRKPLLRLAGYLHDVGKYDAATIKDGELTFAGHEKMAEEVTSDLKKLRFSCREISYIDAVIKTHMRPLKEDTTAKAVRRLLAFLNRHGVKWKTFLQMRIADKSANLAKAPYMPEDIKLRVSKIRQELYRQDNIAFSIKDLAINGNDVMQTLNIKPGKAVGEIMDTLLEKVLENPEINTPQDLKKILMSFKHKD